MLCRKFENDVGDEIIWQLIVQKTLRKIFMEQLHNGVTAGHLGIRKTLERVSARFYWYGWR